MLYTRFSTIILSFFVLLIISCSGEKDLVKLSSFTHKDPKIDFADFIGSNQCQACHADIYEQWKGSSHANAGGPANPANVIAPFDGTPIELNDAIIYPEIVNDVYQFRIEKRNGTLIQTIVVESVVGKGLMINGGTQTFFGKYPDGTYRFLPFDYSKHEDVWFVQLRSDEKWVKIKPEFVLDDLYNWPPHRVIGEIADMSNCQQCHGSQIIAKKVNDVYDVKFTSLEI